MKTITLELAQQTHGFSLKDVPQTFRRSVVDLVTDHAGLVYMGAQVTGDGLVRYARRFVQEGLDPRHTSGAWALASRCVVPVDVAAGLNAQLGQVSGMENTGPGLHPGPLLAHVALAVAQGVRASGERVIEAMAWGFELGARFHYANTGEVNFKQFPVVAAAVAAKVLRLSVEQTCQALSIAAELPARTGNYLRPKIKGRVSALPMGFMQSAFGGTQAALLAQDGFVSICDEIDQWSSDYELDALIRPAQARYLDTRMALKRFPASHGCQMVLQLVEEWRDAGAFDAAAIERIEVTLPHVYLLPHQNEAAPTRPIQSIYGTPWALALVAHGVPPGPAWLDPAVLADRRYLDCAAKVVIREDPEATRAFGALDLEAVRGTVTMTCGSKVLRGEKYLRETWGNASKPLEPGMIRDKFTTLTAKHLEPALRDRLYRELQALESAQDVRELMDRVFA